MVTLSSLTKDFYESIPKLWSTLDPGKFRQLVAFRITEDFKVTDLKEKRLLSTKE